jgi:hypothetical protein
MFTLDREEERCILEFDCDSAYFGEHSFEKLIDACGTECMFTVHSLLNRWNSTNGFRFGIDTSALTENPIYFKSYKAKKINLEQLPNVKVAVCTLDHIGGFSMAIYVSYIGGKFIRKSNMYRNEELAVVTAGMNLVKHILTRDKTFSALTRLTFSKIPQFESKSAQRDIEKCKINCSYNMSPANMKIFASNFQTALEMLNTQEGEAMWKEEYMGMAFAEPLEQKLNFDVVKEFLLDFSHNHYFTANAAGFKEKFKTMNLFVKTKPSGMSLAEIYPEVEERIEEIYSYLKSKLFKGANFGATYYFFDIASTLIPNQSDSYSYFINTDEMKPCLVRFLNKR